MGVYFSASYSKFLRSKDLSTASPRDLDCVLGRKRSGQRSSAAASPRDSGEVPDSKRSRPTPAPGEVYIVVPWCVCPV